MKNILVSIQPKYAELEMNGKKTIELRKFYIEPPFKVVNYVTKSKFHGTGFIFRYSNNELYRLPNGEIKYGDSVELMCYKPEEFSANNFLNGKVAYEYVVNKVDKYLYDISCDNENEKMYYIFSGEREKTRLTYDEFCAYGKGKTLYGFHISDLKIYDKPKSLKDFSYENLCKHYHGGFSDCSDVCGIFENRDCNGGHITLHKAPQNFIYVAEEV